MMKWIVWLIVPTAIGCASKTQLDPPTTVREVTNPLGRLVVAHLVPLQRYVITDDRKSAADWRATQVVLATALYRRSKGLEPPTLRALVAAGFLSSVPQDPLGTGTMGYDPTHRLLWSVGEAALVDLSRAVSGPRTADVSPYVWSSDGVARKPQAPVSPRSALRSPID